MAGPNPKNKKYTTWTKAKRFEKGCELVVHEGWTHQAAADEVGVSRAMLTRKVAPFRAEYEKKVEAAKLAQSTLDQASSPLGLREERRVGTFWEFSDRYWGRWSCPDCGIHHVDPDFHQEIIDTVLEDKRVLRGLVNLPPYHAKSTLITVKHTVYKIVKDPNWRRIIVSQSQDFAVDFVGQIQNLLTNDALYEGGPSLIEDWGPFKQDDTLWSAKRFFIAGRQSVEKDPTVQALGYGGQVYGKRADDIVFDDIATLDNSINPTSVTKMMRKIDQEYLSRIGKTSPAYWVGTRVGAGDIYSILQKRDGYKVLKYPCVIDDGLELTLWPDHFGYEAAIVRRAEMINRDWQLVYQNQDAPGEGASFTQEMLDECKNTRRTTGMFEPGLRLVAGLDLAGGKKTSGYTAAVLIGVDLSTGMRYLIDAWNQKSMRSPVLKDRMLEWCERYPIYAWRVEDNSLQNQLVQYDTELIRKLALQGTRVEPHHTDKNKWDPEFGVESMAIYFGAGMYDIPWANVQTIRLWEQLVEQLMLFPTGMYSDMVMALWFADLGARDLLKRAHLPLFDSRMKVPARIRKKRVIVDLQNKTVRAPAAQDGSPGMLTEVGASGFRRLLYGRPGQRAHEEGPVNNPYETTPSTFANREGSVRPGEPEPEALQVRGT